MKKKAFNFAILALSTILSPLAVASTGAGNGGDALICQNSPDYGDKVILLDTHEARKRKLTLDLSNPKVDNPTHRSMVNTALLRLMQKDVATAEKLYIYAMEMVNDIEMLEQFPEARGKVLYIGNDVVGEINDSLHVTIPIGCELRQLVSQKTPKYRFDYRYEINKAIWDQMDVFEQSMTILHEAWYRIMMENDSDNEHDSYGARYMNGLVASKEFESYSFEDYIRDLRETEMKTYTTINTSTALIGRKISFALTGDIDFQTDKVCVPNVKVPAEIKRFGIRGFFNGITTLDVKFSKACFSNSKMISLELPQKIAQKGFLLSMSHYQISVRSNSHKAPKMLFHSNGSLKNITNVHTDFLVRLFYECDGEEVFSPRRGQECSGPYRYNPSRVNNPGDVYFSAEDETPLGFGPQMTTELKDKRYSKST